MDDSTRLIEALRVVVNAALQIAQPDRGFLWNKAQPAVVEAIAMLEAQREEIDRLSKELRACDRDRQSALDMSKRLEHENQLLRQRVANHPGELNRLNLAIFTAVKGLQEALKKD